MSRHIIHWYQPIIQLDAGSILGYEALLRNVLNIYVSPQNLFKYAKKAGISLKLDTYSLQLAMKNANSMLNTLFVNVLPSTLLNKNFIRWWDNHINLSAPIVLELSEIEPVANWSDLKYTVSELHRRGVKIAIDDMGTGYSSLRHWCDLNPDFVKLDGYYINDLTKDNRKQRVIKSLLNLFENTADLIAEKIETQDELHVIRDLGVKYAQGYILGKPAPLQYIIKNLKGDDFEK
ncbi:EAL domain-containing protein [Caldanaerobius polysaccharolyticus]|uniref:EAL domain-containing protein n=1 Tax=Caldanaerobius polysaccharolyticus TaxID=44256 RepID=UPI00068E6EB8|nr:EAL domain-containing protein [Caldanaerobius polysaccharolyticus]